MMLSQPRKFRSHQKLGGLRKGSSLERLKGPRRCLDFRLVPSRTERMCLCCFKPPNSWYFVTTALRLTHLKVQHILPTQAPNWTSQFCWAPPVSQPSLP